MEGVFIIDNYIRYPNILLKHLQSNVDWDARMVSRKTASFGKPYDYSDMEYPNKPFTELFVDLSADLHTIIGYYPNNVLLNYYVDGKSKMGFHSDRIDILEEGTGVSIISLGETRDIVFKNIENPDVTHTFSLESGSLLHMTAEVQKIWKHAIPKKDTLNERISITLRKIKP